MTLGHICGIVENLPAKETRLVYLIHDCTHDSVRFSRTLIDNLAYSVIIWDRSHDIEERFCVSNIERLWDRSQKEATKKPHLLERKWGEHLLSEDKRGWNT